MGFDGRLNSSICVDDGPNWAEYDKALAGQCDKVLRIINERLI
jgi:hypothetical protein